MIKMNTLKLTKIIQQLYLDIFLNYWLKHFFGEISHRKPFFKPVKSFSVHKFKNKCISKQFIILPKVVQFVNFTEDSLFIGFFFKIKTCKNIAESFLLFKFEIHFFYPIFHGIFPKKVLFFLQLCLGRNFDSKLLSVKCLKISNTSFRNDQRN